MADEKKVDDIQDIPDEYLLCRDLGHSWAPHDVRVSRKAGEIHRILQCRSCPTQRVQILDMNGYRKSSKYVYPEDMDKEATPYKLKGVGHLRIDDLAAIRVMSTNRLRSAARGGLKAVE